MEGESVKKLEDIWGDKVKEINGCGKTVGDGNGNQPPGQRICTGSMYTYPFLLAYS